MATDKPRFSVTFSEDSFAKIQKYQKENNISTQSKAVAKLVALAISEMEIDCDTKKAGTAEAVPDADPLRSTLLENYDQLNQEGKEKLVGLSDDLVCSEKYIKSDPVKLGHEKMA